MINKIIIESGCHIVFDSNSIRGNVPFVITIKDGNTIHIATQPSIFDVARLPECNTFLMNGSRLHRGAQLYVDNRKFTQVPAIPDDPLSITYMSLEDLSHILGHDERINIEEISISGMSTLHISHIFITENLLSCNLIGHTELHILTDEAANFLISTVNISVTGLAVLNMPGCIGKIIGQVYGKANFVNCYILQGYHIDTSGSVVVHIFTRKESHKDWTVRPLMHDISI